MAFKISGRLRNLPAPSLSAIATVPAASVLPVFEVVAVKAE